MGHVKAPPLELSAQPHHQTFRVKKAIKNGVCLWASGAHTHNQKPKLPSIPTNGTLVRGLCFRIVDVQM